MNNLVEALQLIQNYADERKEQSFGMKAIFEICTETLTDFDLARSAIKTTEQPSKAAAVEGFEGILTEEELKQFESLEYNPSVANVITKLIASHRELFKANAELSFKYQKLAKQYDELEEQAEVWREESGN